MACDHADVVASIAGLAGAMFFDPADCQASQPVHVLHMHGDQDTTVNYNGNTAGGFKAPSARTSAEFWANRASCDDTPVEGAPLDLSPDADGAETKVERWEGCDPAGSAQLWTLQGVGHVPGFGDAYVPTIFDYLLSHPKP
jgi:polyhydroxybutyrate depolymerase